jgi:hypothetical protein
MKRTITLAVEVANDDEYAAVIQRAHALQHVIDIQWTWNKGQEGLASLVQTGPMGFSNKWSKLSTAKFTALNEDVVGEEEPEREATDAEVNELADTVIEMITEGALDSQFPRIMDAVDDRLKREADEQAARPGADT